MWPALLHLTGHAIASCLGMPSWGLAHSLPALTAPSQSAGPSQTLENSCLHSAITLLAHRGGLRASFARDLSSASKGTAERLYLCSPRAGAHIYPNAYPLHVQSQTSAAMSLNWRLRTAFVLFVERDMFAQPCVTPDTFFWEFNPQRPGHQPVAAVREEVVPLCRTSPGMPAC